MRYSSDPDIFVSRGDTIEHLSTFDPTVTNVVEETNRTWTVCLTHTDVRIDQTNLGKTKLTSITDLDVGWAI